MGLTSFHRQKQCVTERFTGPETLTAYSERFGTFVVNPIVYFRISENAGNYVDQLQNLSLLQMESPK